MALSPPLAAVILHGNAVRDRVGVRQADTFLLIDTVRESASREQLRTKSVSGLTAQIVEGDLVLSVAIQGYAKGRNGLTNSHPGEALPANVLNWLFLDTVVDGNLVKDTHFGIQNAVDGRKMLYHSPSWEMRPGKLAAVAFVIDVEFANPVSGYNSDVDVIEDNGGGGGGGGGGGTGGGIGQGTSGADPDPPAASKNRYRYTFLWETFGDGSGPSPYAIRLFQFVYDAQPGTTEFYREATMAAAGFDINERITAGAPRKWHPGDGPTPVAPVDCEYIRLAGIFSHGAGKWVDAPFMEPYPTTPVLPGGVEDIPHWAEVTAETGQATYVVYRWSKVLANHNVGVPELWMGAWDGLEELLAAIDLGYTLAQAKPAVIDNTPFKAIWQLGAGWIHEVTHPADTTPWTKPTNVLSQFKLP